MFDQLLTSWLQWCGGTPCFQIYGKAGDEAAWRVIDVFATTRRNQSSRWPFWGGACTTWTSRVISVGWDFAEWVVREESGRPASREAPVKVAGGRLRDLQRREQAGATPLPRAVEVLAHECGHTRQAMRLGLLYLPMVGSVTLLREGDRWWNRFENDASERGMFGGIVPGSITPPLAARTG